MPRRPSYDQPISYNPCLECKLCVAACPVGAIAPDGHFNFSACYTHNYREFMGGFTDWVEQVADSKDALDYRKRVERPGIGVDVAKPLLRGQLQGGVLPGVCPAGEDVIGPYLTDAGLPAGGRPPVAGEGGDGLRRPRLGRRGACPGGSPSRGSSGSAAACGPGRSGRSCRGCLTPSSGRPRTGLNATYHFTFTGKEPEEATVTIRGNDPGPGRPRRHGRPPYHRRQRDVAGLPGEGAEPAWALLRRKIRLKGSPRLLVAFGSCFPS